MDKIVDTDFEEISDMMEKKNIKGEILYYNTIQVATILEENDSTVRYWAKVFSSMLRVKLSNEMRKYTKNDIEKMKFIKHLIRDNKLTLKQVEEYCSEKGFNSEEGLIDDSNPLAVQTFTSAMTVEMDKKIAIMQNNIIQQQQEMINSLQKIILENNESLRQELSLTIDESVSEKLNEFGKNIIEEQKQQAQVNSDNINAKNKERDIELVKNLMQLMQERKTEQKEKPKGIFGRIFHNKK